MRRYGYIGIVVFLAAIWVLFWRMGGDGYAAQPTGYIALTFDDGPHDIYTQQLLDGLEERNVQVSFFLLGESIKGNEQLVQRMEEAGHLIGNHTYRHIQMTMANEKEVFEYVDQTNQLIAGITGITPEYLRPPYGDWNDDLDGLVNMSTVFWSVDSRDWSLQNSDQIVNRVMKKVGDADIILMHDIFPSSVEAALEIVDRLQAQGYVFVTVDELLID